MKEIKIHSKIEEIPQEQWNSLVVDNNPFVKHEFLKALEDHRCVGNEFGWLPRHIAIYEKSEGGQTVRQTSGQTSGQVGEQTDGQIDEQSELIAAMPLYEKYNSYGEFVFDHAWADAWKRAGLHYFPKLVSSIPYTPAQGQRLLAKPESLEEAAPMLLQVVVQIAKSNDISGLHILFPADEEQQWLENQGLLVRHDCQFHWHNENYECFDDFLDRLTAKKRKNIRQERKRVQKSGITLRVLDGHTATEGDWDDMARFYLNTFTEKWGTATLNARFFKQVAKEMPDQIVLVLADKTGAAGAENKEDQCIAGSLMYRSDTTLYGRYWGCDEAVDQLHFEACYYQGIEYCIEHGLELFEPGAQGEHKIARGFLPTLTKSSHWLTENPFRESIQRYTEHEQEAVAEYIESCSQHSPYKSLKQVK